MFKNALVSVSDKTGLGEFIGPLTQQGLRVVSTGGTAKFLRSLGITVLDVSEQTGFAEVMGGRVKTLHPKIHMALLAREENEEDQQVLKAHGIEAFDLVVGNLYPFEQNLRRQLPELDLVESIDIGGPSFLRAAAKSYSRTAVLCDPQDYQQVLTNKDTLTITERKKLAAKVFRHVSGYDALIAEWMNAEAGREWALAGDLVQSLRYGENPQQQGFWYSQKGAHSGLHQAKILQGKALSYNNLLDLDAAIATLREFQTELAVVSVKHNNPCGLAVGNDPLEVLKLGLQADPVSVFGGIVALNFTVQKEQAELLAPLFLECLIAPRIADEAKIVLAKKKNFRVLEWPDLPAAPNHFDVKTVLGGFLMQTADVETRWSDHWRVIGEKPTTEVQKSLLLAWKTAKHLKSNAIAIAGNGQSLGLGMGQVNRVDAVEQAILRWQKHHSQVQQPVLASDAFFPFADSIEQIAKAGIRWVIQPGGSLRDEEVFKAAQEFKVSLVLTGVRHFRH